MGKVNALYVLSDQISVHRCKQMRNLRPAAILISFERKAIVAAAFQNSIDKSDLAAHSICCNHSVTDVQVFKHFGADCDLVCLVGNQLLRQANMVR